MTYLDTAYRDRARLVEKLDEAGIRHVRDGLSWNTHYAYDTFNELADRGIRTTFIMGRPNGPDTLEELLTVLRSEVPRAAEAVEGPNEYHHGGSPPWHEELRSYQARLYSEVKGDPALRHLPVLAPSLVTWQDHAALGNIREYLDFGNKHPYPGGDVPEANLDSELATTARVSGNAPVQVTETGYHNALATTGGHRPTSEEAAATYIPRMYLEYFRRGITRTFAYELIDEWPDPARRNQEANFGLLRNDYSEKPAFRSLSNLIAVLEDGASGATAPVTPLEYTVTDAPSDLRQLVLQKRDGSHYLVLWRAARVWDPVARRPLPVAERTMSVQLGDASRTFGLEAQLFDPVESDQPFANAPASQPIQLSLGADPVIVRLPAASSTPQPPPAPSTRQPPPPPRDARAPALQVDAPSTQTLSSVPGQGGVMARVRSSERSTIRAAARLTERSARRLSINGRRFDLVGRTRLQLPAARGRSMRVPVRRGVQRQLGRVRQAKVLLRVTATDRAGNRRVVWRRITVRLAA